ncbi:carboxypeptidase-like regulatory domain-containing protein [Elizabethkingia occulta]|uniref:carboxypeptidase-like regulatory domain-containing protein n=1 Tax=Elizabethkingia occulta TaxID=1867263 RepID=UPI00398C720E
MKNIIILIITTLTSFSLAQKKEIRGTVLSNETNLPIEFVTIGIKDSPFATITNKQGEFKMNIPDGYENSQIKITSIGYESKVYNIHDYSSLSDNRLYLIPKIINIPEVLLTKEQNYKTEKIGTESTSTKIVTGWSSGPGKGGERGILIKTKNKAYYIKDINFHVAENNFKNLNIRLHIRKLKDNFPDQELLQSNIIIPVTINKGWVREDISKYKIKIDEPVVVSLEWLDHSPCNQNCNFLISLNYFSGKLYAKEASESKWIIKNGMSPGIFINVYQLDK